MCPHALVVEVHLPYRVNIRSGIMNDLWNTHGNHLLIILDHDI